MAKIEDKLTLAGIIFTLISFITVPFLPNEIKTDYSGVIKGFSISLFCAGIFFKVNKIHEEISNLKDKNEKFEKENRKNINKLLQGINLNHPTDQPFHLQTVCKVFNSSLREEIIRHGKNIIDYIESPRKTKIVIDNITPAYKLMKVIVDDLEDGSAYIATSKLSSYNSIPNENFQGFSNVLAGKVRRKEIFSCRLYYLDKELDDQRKYEIEEDKKLEMIVKYNEPEKSNFDYYNSLDLAFIMLPKKRNSSVSMQKLVEDFNNSTSHGTPIEFLKQNGYNMICVIIFNLTLRKLDNNIFFHEVKNMEIISPDYDGDNKRFSEYVEEFNRNWMIAKDI